MKNLNSDRFYKANEEISLRFYQMPKVLFNNPIYKGLSLGAKAMYSILRDRQELSIANNQKNEDQWVDEDGNIYLLFSTEPRKGDERTIDEKPQRELSLTELIDITKNTVTAYKKELIKYGLIVTKKMGQGKVDRIYVLKPELPSTNVGIYKTPKNEDSRIPNSESLESQKLTGSDTDLSETDLSDTIFLSPEESDVDNELPVDNLNNERKKESNTNKTNEFNKILNACQYEMFHDSKAILQAIRMLYYSNETLKIGTMAIPPNQVREDLKLLRMEHLDYAISDFDTQSKEQEIRYPIAYLSRCIYNAIFQGDLKFRSEVNYSGYN